MSRSAGEEGEATLGSAGTTEWVGIKGTRGFPGHTGESHLGATSSSAQQDGWGMDTNTEAVTQSLESQEKMNAPA